MNVQEVFDKLGEIIYDGGGDLDVLMEQACFGQIQRDIVQSVGVTTMNGVQQVLFTTEG